MSSPASHRLTSLPAAGLPHVGPSFAGHRGLPPSSPPPSSPLSSLPSSSLSSPPPSSPPRSPLSLIKTPACGTRLRADQPTHSAHQPCEGSTNTPVGGNAAVLDEQESDILVISSSSDSDSVSIISEDDIEDTGSDAFSDKADGVISPNSGSNTTQRQQHRHTSWLLADAMEETGLDHTEEEHGNEGPTNEDPTEPGEHEHGFGLGDLEELNTWADPPLLGVTAENTRGGLTNTSTSEAAAGGAGAPLRGDTPNQVPTSQAQALLDHLKCYLDRTRSLYLWDTQGEHNPIWDFKRAPMIGEHVVNLVCQYLSYHANLSRTTSNMTVAVPPSIHHAICVHDPGVEVREQVWTQELPPARIVLPVVDLANLHCYVWYGDTELEDGKYSITLNYLDSLGSPKQNVWYNRFNQVHKVVMFLFPGLNGLIKGAYHEIPGYRQRPGSLDCGIFVCQAISALVLGGTQPLYHLLPVDMVRQRIDTILHLCRQGALEDLSRGICPSPVVHLHRVVVQPEPPPWTLSPTRGQSAAKHTPHPLGVSSQLGAGPAPISTRTSERGAKRSLSFDAIAASLLAEDTKEPLPSSIPQSQSHSRRESSARSGFSFVYGRRSEQRFPSTLEYQFDPFFDDLENQTSSWPKGRITNGLGRDHEALLRAALLSNPTHARLNPPGISVVNRGVLRGKTGNESSLNLQEYINTMRDLPDAQAKVRAFLTGQVRGEQLSLNWLKDTLDLDEDYVEAATDVDSLSLTVDDPEFSMPVAINAYPSRASTLSTDNGLRVLVDNKEHPLSHFLNFTCFTLGSNNQFRVNVFFPRYVVPRMNNRRYRTFMDADDYQLWYDRVVLHALELAFRKAPSNLRLAFLQAQQELPASYLAATTKVHGSDGSRNFAGYKVTHEVLNLMIPEMRRIVDTTLELAKFRDYFFHIWGINLKTVGQQIPGRAGGSPLRHIFRTYPIVPWERQNPQDVFVDFAVEVFIHSDKLPAQVSYATMMWNQDVMARLMGSTYQTPQYDAYLHSTVVGGLRARTRTRASQSVVKYQCYQKDKEQTYVHADNSIGTGFTPLDALGFTKRYALQIQKLRQAWSHKGSFGVRAEWRCSAWAAHALSKRDPSEWLQRFIEAEAIVMHPTQRVFNLKSYALKIFWNVLYRQQRLTARQKNYESVQLLTVVVTYLIKGLVKRPDDMSSSRSMASRLQLIQRARDHGFPTVQPHMLSECLTRLEGQVEVDEWPILNFLNRKQPGGARLKSSVAGPGKQGQKPPGSSLHAEDPGTPEVQNDKGGPEPSIGLAMNQLGEGDRDWARGLINVRLSMWLWERFPEQYLRTTSDASLLHGPWRLSGWNVIVAEDLEQGFRRRAGKGFQDIVEQLLPVGWMAYSQKGQWRTYQEAILDRIRGRIVRHSGPGAEEYANLLREALLQQLRAWEYLPATQQHRIWVLETSGIRPRFMLHRNLGVFRS
ncbi:hypothetical protein FRC08_006826 [Ceratobasidium sp. 394]|nr:hypothetical protein FRC08_006826 [Ceratobasidium sp. 394]KAG9101277.1 hypothetical protein FS749_008501 [Ceratobasidium sp. UAMH 11750]